MKISPFQALLMSFATWLGIGILLLYKGLTIFMSTLEVGFTASWMAPLVYFTGDQEYAVLLCISFALFLGFLKGKFVLKKTVTRISARFFSFQRPMSLKEVYPRYYLLIILVMMSMGMFFKFIPIASEFKGMIDVAVGAALINGSLQYFRMAFSKGEKVEIK